MSKHFFKVPNAIFQHQLPPYPFVILCFLLRCRNKDGRCFPSIQTISKQLKISKSSVCKYLGWLEKEGYICSTHVFHYGRQTNNEYIIIQKYEEDSK